MHGNSQINLLKPYIVSLRQHVVFWVLMSCSTSVIAEPMLITYRSPESDKDERQKYNYAVLRLALEKTKADYGDYKLVPSGMMNNIRAIDTLRNHTRENFFVKLSYESEFPDFMEYIRFPVDLGIVGKRVCFISPNAKQRLSDKPNLEELKTFTHGQGKGWLDVKVLKHNGFIVEVVNIYDNKFYMVANNRFDFFCRGVNELKSEYEKFGGIENLDFDRTFAFVYPLPRFFYTHRANKDAIKRVTEGIMRAYKDGSLIKLWHAYYQESVEFSELHKRVKFHLNNPSVKDIDFDYERYFYSP